MSRDRRRVATWFVVSRALGSAVHRPFSQPRHSWQVSWDPPPSRPLGRSDSHTHMRRMSSRSRDTLAEQIQRAMKVVSHGSEDLEKIAEQTAMQAHESYEEVA